MASCQLIWFRKPGPAMALYHLPAHSTITPNLFVEALMTYYAIPGVHGTQFENHCTRTIMSTGFACFALLWFSSELLFQPFGSLDEIRYFNIRTFKGPLNEALQHQIQIRTHTKCRALVLIHSKNEWLFLKAPFFSFWKCFQDDSGPRCTKSWRPWSLAINFKMHLCFKFQRSIHLISHSIFLGFDTQQ